MDDWGFIVVAFITGMSTVAAAAVPVWLKDRKKLNEVQRQVTPRPNGDHLTRKGDPEETTLGQIVWELRDDVVTLTDLFSTHISDRHGPELFRKRSTWRDLT